jgi:spore germination protein YaaH
VLAVRAVDTRGRRSAVSRRIRVAPGHAGPSAPAGLTVTGTSSSTVGLAWEASSVAAGRVVGYRVARNGAPLFQTAATSATAASLAASTTYTFTVAAVDGHGYLGPPSAPVSATTVDPAPATGGLHAFLLATTDRSFEDLQAHYDRIGTLYPTYFDCRADGQISGREDPLVTRYAQQRRIAVLPRYNCQNGAVVHTILTNPQIRAATLANLAALVDAHGYDGLNFESGYATDRAALTGYVADLAALLHARGKRLSVDVSAKTADAPTGRAAFYDYPAIAEHADHVFVMNWGKHWSTSAPGAMDDLPWARAVADHVAAMPHRERFVLGFPLYGMDWAAGGGAAHPGEPMEHARLQGLVAAVGAAPVLDPVAGSWHFSYTDGAGVGHEVWYGDATTFAQRIALARDRGLGVGVWRLGSEDQRLWDLPGLAAP